MSFFTKATNWIKANKLSSFLIALFVFFILKNNSTGHLLGPVSRNTMYESFDASDSFMGVSSVGQGIGGMGGKMQAMPIYSEAAPRPDIQDRMVITDSSLSLLVKDVRTTVKQIQDKTNELKGYTVSTHINQPEFGASGYMTIRVPNTSLPQTLEFLRSQAIKVVSENMSGRDITDEYEDIQAKLDRYQTTLLKFEAIMERTENVDEILRVQNEIINVQSQIDALKGRVAYLQGSSASTLITINLSTDELGLPYAPAEGWRPEVVFKQAVRGLLVNLRSLGNMSIWLIVYSPLIVGIILAYKLFRTLTTRKSLKK
ncbi:DUF4349 domain-containing protein [Patescibacteria group bacterium]|nr:DUF4349 domain-containing protein [Patescibacteria group bacterium]